MGDPVAVAACLAGEETIPSLVSVVIPTYNRWELLQPTIESVLAQTYPAIEVIVVDDGSTDETQNHLKDYRNRVKVIRQENQGGTAARNRGLQAAQGQYVSVLDHDDLWLPEKISRQVRVLEQNPRLGLVHCRWYFIDLNGKRIDKIGPLPAGNVLKELLLGCFLWSGGPLIRHQCLTEVGLFDEAVWSSDWDLWMRIALAGYPFGCVQLPLGCYRITPGSAMADISRTEQADKLIFEKTFRDARLPAALTALQPQALANWRSWLSRRYYAEGQWEDARRNLSLALQLYPPLFEDRQAFFDLLVNEALDVRVTDALGFIHGVLDHLPMETEAALSQKEALLGKVLNGMALKAFASGDIAGARSLLSESLALSPQMFIEGDYFAHQVFAWAMRLVDDPLNLVSLIMENLPPEGIFLRRDQRRITGDILIGCAFEAYYAEHFRQVISLLMRGILRHPVWLRNRGVSSIFMKSLFRQIQKTAPIIGSLPERQDLGISSKAEYNEHAVTLGEGRERLASIIIPVYNQARYAASAVACALAQTWSPLEVIVVDDGSSDDARQALSPFLDQIIFLQVDHGGLARARNIGYRRSRGEYLLFLDADDQIPPEKLTRHIDIMEANPSIGLVYSGWQQVSEDGEQILGEVHPSFTGDALRGLLRRDFFFFASSAVLRRACLEQVGVFDESLPWSEDSDLWLRLASAGIQFRYLDESLLAYRMHPASMTSNLSSAQVQSWQAGLDKFFGGTSLPADILEMREEAVSILHFETAGRYFRIGDIPAAQAHFTKALAYNPQVKIEWLLEWAAGTALDPRSQDAERLIDRIFENLPPQAAWLIRWYHPALSRYHTAAAFSAYRSHNPVKARQHLLPAFRNDPRILKNRGFLRLSAWAVLGGRLFA